MLMIISPHHVNNTKMIRSTVKCSRCTECETNSYRTFHFKFVSRVYEVLINGMATAGWKSAQNMCSSSSKEWNVREMCVRVLLSCRKREELVKRVNTQQVNAVSWKRCSKSASLILFPCECFGRRMSNTQHLCVIWMKQALPIHSAMKVNALKNCFD